MKREGDDVGGSGKPNPEAQWILLNRIAHRIVAKRLAAETQPISPWVYGRKIKEQLTSEEKAELSPLQDMMLEAVLAQQAKQQTRPKPAKPRDTGELFPDVVLDEWMAAESPKLNPSEVEEEGDEADEADSGGAWRIKVRFATWVDHQTFRENQIISQRKANRSFEVWEQRRDVLKAAGMGADPRMTTEVAVKRAGL